MPKLQSIHLGYMALHGDDRDDRKTIEKEPYNFNNTLIMKSVGRGWIEWTDLPLLTSYKGIERNYGNIGSVILESSDWGVR